MATVLRWTGREARLLREAMRLSVRGFAVHLGYNDAAVSNWERRGTNARLCTQTQCDLDAALKLADDDARERFSGWFDQAGCQA
jgi:transcriptional regulator with XRE-family HTH domain